MTNLEQIASDLVDRAKGAGATAADVVVREADEFSTTLRTGKIESLKEAASKALGLRVLLGIRSASSYSSDFSEQSLGRLVERTIAMAKVTSEDPASGLPEQGQLGCYAGDLDLFSSDVESLSTGDRIQLARRAEEAALGADPRIQNSEGAGFEASQGTVAYANSLGFVGSYRSSYCALSVSPIAQQNGGMQRDFWYSVARRAAALEAPEAVGRKAAQRVLRKLGARKVSTCQVPVVFDPETARSLLGHVFDAVRGDAIYRSASFLTGKLHQKIANENVTILDDGLRSGGFGSRPFDGEGIPSSITPVIRKGCPSELSAELLHGSETGFADHRQCLARDCRPARCGAQEFLYAARSLFPGRNTALRGEWVLRNGVDWVRGEYCDRGLFAWGCRDVG